MNNVNMALGGRSRLCRTKDTSPLLTSSSGYHHPFVTVLAAVLALFAVVGMSSGTSAQVRTRQYKVLYSFTGTNDGAGPNANLIFDAEGNLYGTAEGGGSYTCTGGCGTVFRLTPNADGTWALSVLHEFNSGEDGAWPLADLVFDVNGSLYGTTGWGGAGGYGVLFQLTPDVGGNWTERVLQYFDGGKNGGIPYSGVTFEPAGNLYGTTEAGGDPKCFTGGVGCGVVFKMTPNSDGSWTETVIHNFESWDGVFPSAGLVFDQEGSLYGTTRGNPDQNMGYGGVFMLKPNSDGTWTFSTLHLFTGGYDGATPVARLILDASGNLYGTTSEGGRYGHGTAFMLKSKGGSWKKFVLHHFTGGIDGSKPTAALLLDSAGNLYGTTHEGGADGLGTVFMLRANGVGGWTTQALHQFTGGKDGASPWGSLISDAKGNLYGTAQGGGVAGAGVVFELISTTAQ